MKGSAKQALHRQYADPLPYNIVSLPPLIPHNPVSLLYYLWVWFTANVEQQSYKGVWDAKSRSVHVTDQQAVYDLWHRGFFGKGNLSRSEPSWFVRTQRALGLIGREDQLSSEEVTARRRQERREFKRERAEKEWEQLREVYDREGKLDQLPPLKEPPPIKDEAVIPSVELINGKLKNREHLQLTMEEAFFLAFALGVLHVFDGAKECTALELFDLFRESSSIPKRQVVQPDDPFILSYVAYHHYRSLGWVVKPGIKFSVDFLLYKKGPVFSHAEFAVLLLPTYTTLEGYSTTARPWHWLHCVNRVNAQVKKTVILAFIEVPSSLDHTNDIVRTLEQYRVREVSVRRWQANRMR